MTRASPELACPRCGYDVSGAVPTWTEQCPREGTCSECGLVYVWVDIFRPERVHPKWSFEHAAKRRLRALIKTMFFALRPARFWSAMSLAAPIRPFRLALMVLILALVGHTAAAGLECYLHWSDFWVIRWTGAARSITTPTGLRVPTPRPGTLTFDGWELARVLAWPYSRGYGHWRLIGPLGLLALVWGMLVPLPYLVLVDTMKKAKCRPAHLGRGWAYFVPSLCVLLVVDLIMMCLQHLIPRSPGWLTSTTWNVAAAGLLLFFAAWCMRWWKRFTTSYLRLEQARLVTTLMLTISFLAAVSICLFLDREWVDLVGSCINFFLG